MTITGKQAFHILVLDSSRCVVAEKMVCSLLQSYPASRRPQSYEPGDRYTSEDSWRLRTSTLDT